MLLILSPSKTMKTVGLPRSSVTSMPGQLKMAKPIVRLLKQKSTTELAALMKINPKLAQLNYERHQQWHTPFNNSNACSAVFSYHGEVFNGLQIDSFSAEDLAYAQQHLRILSGLYGVLRPLDLIQPYRLEMATRLTVGKAKNLYEYWRTDITETLARTLKTQGDQILVNLASNEYFRSIDHKLLNVKVITPVFKEYKNNESVTVTMYTKKARGMMARYLLQNKINTIDALKLFNLENYYYNDALSNQAKIVFTR